MTNLKVLKETDDLEWVWSFKDAKDVLDKYVQSKECSKEEVYEQLSDKLHLTAGAAKNWFTKKNGPGDIDQVKTMAGYFGVDYTYLVNRLKVEDGKDNLYDAEDVGFDDDLLDMFINREVSFDFKIVKFVEMLNMLAQQSRYGYRPFSEYTYRTRDFDGIVFIDRTGPHFGKIAFDMCLDEYHHDVVSTYNDFVRGVEYDARVIDDEEDGYYIEITCEQNVTFVVIDGRWYSC